MSLISIRDKTINAKIVYYGTALSGKTTSLKYVHDVIDPERRIELVSLNTEGDRTLFFDFLPIPLGTISGYKVKLQAFTVPGQVKYNLTRRYVLRAADAVIFVADSRPEAFDDNLHSIATLAENLEANGISPEGLPLVIQYNKRDVPNAVPVERLRAALNLRGAPDFSTTATDGTGVFEAFAELCSGMMSKVAREYRIAGPDEVRRVLGERLLTIATDASARVRRPAPPAAETKPKDDLSWTTADLLDQSSEIEKMPTVIAIGVDDGSSDAEKLLEKAVESNIASAQILAELNETKNRLADHVRQLAALNETGVVISSELSQDRLLGRILEAALRTVGSPLGSVLLLGVRGDSLEEKLVHGFSHDPLARGGATEPRFVERVLGRRPFVLESPEDRDLLTPENPEDPRPAVALVAPIVHQVEVLGALVAYLVDRPLDADVQLRLRFLGMVAAQAGVALENARLYARLDALNRELEEKVAERTRELEQAYRDLQVLDKLKDDFLSSMSHELLTPLTSISSFAEILSGIAGDDAAVAAAERTEFASIVHREAARLTDMLQMLLDLSRLEAGKITFVPGPVDLRDALLASYKRVRPAFKARNILVKVKVDEAMPPARIDARWIGRALDALLGNAAKFGPENSEVHVGIRKAGTAQARIEVRDYGPGVPETLRRAIFDKFKQLGDVLTDKPAGLGLGLPMARAIVERHGGAIWHEPAPGGGSIFAFSVPVVPVPPGETKSKTVPVAAPAPQAPTSSPPHAADDSAS